MKKATSKAKCFWRGLSRAAQIVILTLVALVVICRSVMPYAVERYVNHKLQQLPGYGGSVGDVDIHLYRGAYTIYAVEIVKKTNSVPIPFLKAERVDLSVQWKELRNHALVAEVELDRAQLNFVKSETEEQDQTRIDGSWVEVVQDLFPFKINRFEIRDSQVHYADLASTPKVDVAITNLHILCRNITNSRDLTNELPTSFEVTGITIGGGKLTMSGEVNPFMESPRFDVDAKLEGVDLTALNDFLRAYAKVDVKSGKLDFYTEMAAADGRFKGYAKPLLLDVDIVDLKQDIKNPLKLFWESVVAGVVKLFKNHPKDQVAAKVPIEGDIDNVKASIVEALGSVLRNAFVRALAPHLDGTIDLESAKLEKGERPPQRDTEKNEKSAEKKSRENQEEKK